MTSAVTATTKPEIPRHLAIGDRLTWHRHLVEVLDLAQFGPDWHQVVVGFLDDRNQPPASMLHQDLCAGLGP